MQAHRSEEKSIGTRNVTVRSNLFEKCNRGAASAEAPLAALAWLKDSAYPLKPGGSPDITFEGNRFVGAEGNVILAVGVSGLTIRSNRVESSSGLPVESKDLIRVLNCARVSREGQ